MNPNNKTATLSLASFPMQVYTGTSLFQIRTRTALSGLASPRVCPKAPNQGRTQPTSFPCWAKPRGLFVSLGTSGAQGCSDGLLQGQSVDGSLQLIYPAPRLSSISSDPAAKENHSSNLLDKASPRQESWLHRWYSAMNQGVPS